MQNPNVSTIYIKNDKQFLIDPKKQNSQKKLQHVVIEKGDDTSEADVYLFNETGDSSQTTNLITLIKLLKKAKSVLNKSLSGDSK